MLAYPKMPSAKKKKKKKKKESRWVFCKNG
jgi:hypothetical protein